MASAVASNPMARVQREQEFQMTADLVNKFVISTTQFLNRFAAVCDAKLFQTRRSLQRLEVLTILLEKKLSSIDAVDVADEAGGRRANGKAAGPATTPSVGDGGAAAGQRRGVAGISDPNAPPPMPGLNAPRSQLALPPPPSQSGGPPLPPGMIAPVAGVPGTGVVSIGGTGIPPALPGQPPAGFVPPPPPPMPLLGGFTMRTHPRLKGYFAMAAARIPVSAIQEKMRADGYMPEWLDTPDAPAPGSLSSKPKDASYESD